MEARRTRIFFQVRPPRLRRFFSGEELLSAFRANFEISSHCEHRLIERKKGTKMNKQAVKNIIWKEFRTLRGFWLAMLAFGLVAEAFADWQNIGGVSSSFYEVKANFWPVLASFAVIAFYSLGCGCTAFAGEKESGTYQFLQALPTKASEVIIGKIAFFLVSFAVMLGIGIACLYLLNRPGFLLLFRTKNVGAVVGLYFLMTANLLVCGALFSLLTSHPLASGVFGAILAGIGNYLMMPEYDILTWSFNEPQLRIPAAFVFIAIVATADWRLAKRWLRENSRSGGKDSASAIPQIVRDYATKLTPRGPKERGFFRHLFWQYLRQSILSIAALYVMFLSAPLLNYSISDEGFRLLFRLPPAADWRFPLCFTFFLCTPICGTLAFNETRRQTDYRFLGSRGVSPNVVWLARIFSTLLIWAPMVIAYGAAVFSLNARFNSGWISQLELLQNIFLLCAIPITLYCVGLFSSVAVRGSLLAFVIAEGASLGCGFAIIGCCKELGWLWPAFFFPALFLVASRLRLGNLLADRAGWRSWRIATLWSILATLLTFVGASSYRAFEYSHVPGSYPAVTQDSYNAAEADKTGALYVAAAKKLQPAPQRTGENYIALTDYESPEWVQANEETLRLLSEASQSSECRIADENAIDQLIEVMRRNRSYGGLENALSLFEDFQLLLIADANLQMKRGDLDFALVRLLDAFRVKIHRIQIVCRLPHNKKSDISATSGFYGTSTIRTDGNSRTPEDDFAKTLLAWSLAKNQISQRVVEAAKGLQAIERSAPRHIQLLLANMQRANYFAHQSASTHQNKLYQWFPWERQRTAYLAEAAIEENWLARKDMLKAIDDGTPPNGISVYDSFSWLDAIYCLRNEKSPSIFGMHYSYKPIREMYVAAEFRAMILQLALVAWQLDHQGDLPEKLDDLVGVYLDALPLDPATGKAFHYRPKGITSHAESPEDKAQKKPAWPPNGVPFIASTNFIPSFIVKKSFRTSLTPLLSELQSCTKENLIWDDKPTGGMPLRDDESCFSPWFEIPLISKPNDGGKK